MASVHRKITISTGFMKRKKKDFMYQEQFWWIQKVVD